MCAEGREHGLNDEFDRLTVEGDKKSCLEKAEEDMKYHSGEELTLVPCPQSADNSFAFIGGPEAAARNERSDDAASSALDVSDSELLARKKTKPCVLDAALDDADGVDEGASGSGDGPPAASEPAAAATTLPPDASAPCRTPVAHPDATSSFLPAVQSFPLPPGHRHRPVVGPPALDQDAVRRMQQLHIPVSLPPEDVERIARLEKLKQLSC